MRTLKFRLFFLVYLAAFSNQTNSTTIQRLRILGFNDVGDRGAFMLLHFGPSSGAPSARIVVFDANNNTPVFNDEAMFMSGGEAELAQLATQLLEKNKNKLVELRINLSSPLYDEANYIVEKSTPLSVFGKINSEYIDLQEFSVRTSAPPSNCKYGGLTIDVCLLSNCSKVEECGAQSIQLRNIYRSKNSLWFIIFQKHTVFEDMASYFISPVGLKF